MVVANNDFVSLHLHTHTHTHTHRERERERERETGLGLLAAQKFREAKLLQRKEPATTYERKSGTQCSASLRTNQVPTVYAEM
jgi:hypothetical protein